MCGFEVGRQEREGALCGFEVGLVFQAVVGECGSGGGHGTSSNSKPNFKQFQTIPETRSLAPPRIKMCVVHN